jgi:hypothetical protein
MARENQQDVLAITYSTGCTGATLQKAAPDRSRGCEPMILNNLLEKRESVSVSDPELDVSAAPSRSGGSSACYYTDHWSATLLSEGWPAKPLLQFGGRE